jgi:hypothetical protein
MLNVKLTPKRKASAWLGKNREFTSVYMKIPLNPPLLKGDFIIPLFGKEGLGEIFIVLCDGRPS